MAHESIAYDDPSAGDTRSGDVDLATVELAVDAKIAPRVDGHILFKYEEADVWQVYPNVLRLCRI